MRSNPRLLFSEDEQAPTEQPTSKTKQPPNNTKSTTIPKNESSTTQQRTVHADNGKKAVRLHFKEAEQKRPAKSNHIAKKALVSEIHKKVEDSADDNVAVEATNRTEQAVETGFRLSNEHLHASKAQSARAATLAERETPKSNMSFSRVKATSDTNKKDSNPLSRWRQRPARERQSWRESA